MYMMVSSVHFMVNPMHLLADAVHPSEAPDVHDGICSTPVGKYSTPSEAPDLHDRIYAVHPSGAPDVLYMI